MPVAKILGVSSRMCSAQGCRKRFDRSDASCHQDRDTAGRFCRTRLASPSTDGSSTDGQYIIPAEATAPRGIPSTAHRAAEANPRWAPTAAEKGKQVVTESSTDGGSMDFICIESSTNGSSNDGIRVVVDLISTDEEQMASKKKKKGMQDEGGSKMKVTSQFGLLNCYICELQNL
jgi:hypothetical protein